MELSKKERLTLINQYLILEKLYPEDAKYYGDLRIALENGFTKHYPDIFRGMSEELSVEECQEVIEILKMHRALNWSYDNLEEKAGIDKEELKFSGYDLNDVLEAQYADYAKYYMHNLNLFTDLRAENEYETYNSHRLMLNRYRRMLEVWHLTEDPDKLKAQEIKDIINA
ncbi:YfbU family protein [Bacillus cereus group sp. BfR-BA-01380]|uniref:YfbU family protein n=1 Tax=Bacillus cereus group sp. BfR-BA-01380 TaxID=2920324 RepID=UPI001F5A247C|nr:YfbU family protein [Bacillus cereus group sp. BfR-BA-01380]